MIVVKNNDYGNYFLTVNTFRYLFHSPNTLLFSVRNLVISTTTKKRNWRFESILSIKWILLHII